MTAKTTHYYLSNLDPKRITIARELRGLTKKALAEKINRTPSAISQFESGQIQPEVETFSRLALALNFPPAFFAITNSPTIDVSCCHFRAKRSVPQIKRRQAAQYASIVLHLFKLLEDEGVIFPSNSLPRYDLSSNSSTEIDNHSLSLRKYWGIGLGPLPNLLNFLESKGIFIIIMDTSLAGIDAFSFWFGDRACIVLDTDLKKGSRIQFDLAHELGHLLLHDEKDTYDLSTERQANRFGGSFLAPSSSFYVECPSRWNEYSFIEIKKRWNISIQAALYRARQINRITESSFRWAMMQLSSKGNRTTEPAEFKAKSPLLLSQAFDLIKNDFSLDCISDKIGIQSNFLKQILLSQHVPQETIESMVTSPPTEVHNLVQIKKKKKQQP